MTYANAQNGQTSMFFPDAESRVCALAFQTQLTLAVPAPQLALAVLFSILFTMLAGVPMAYADTPNEPQIAALPQTAPPLGGLVDKRQEPPKHTTLSAHGVCDDGVVVLRVKNGAKPWRARGDMQVIDVQTGQVVRQRKLRFNAGQSASFRIGPDQVPSHRYRIIVTAPDGAMRYVKSFRGRCPQPFDELRAARR